MSGRQSIVLTISTFLGLGLTAAPVHCETVRAQEQQVLSKAIKMALEIKPLPVNEIEDISFFFRNAGKDQSEWAETLFKHVRESAAHTTSAAQYTDASQAANYILTYLDQLSPDSAQELFESWPALPSFENQYKDFKNRFEANKQRNRLVQNPLNYVNEYIPPENTNTWLALVGSFFSRPADQRKVFERLLSECEKQSGKSSSSPRALSRFLDPGLWDAPLFSRYTILLKRDGSQFTYELSCEGQSTALNYVEGEAFQIILHVARNHFDIATEMLQVVPSLKEKTERVGGFKSIWDRGEFRGGRPFVGRPILYRGHQLDAKIDALCEQSNPDEVRQALANS